MNTIRWGKSIKILITILLLEGCWYDYAVAAQSVADYYKGKRITWICPFSPGGGNDTWARVMASALQKHTGATVVVKNMPGGSGLVGSNYMYTKAKPDGLTIGNTQTLTMVVDYLFSNPSVQYDLKKFTWLDRLSTDIYVVSVGKNSRYRNLKEIKTAPRFKMALDSRTSNTCVSLTAFAMALGLENATIVAGYAGTSESKLSVLAGESDATSTSIGSQWQQLRAGQFIPIALTSKERAKDLPDVPTIYDLNPNMPTLTKKWVDRLTTLLSVGRAVFAPPGVPKDKADFLREVIRKALKDPDVITRLAKHKYYVEHMKSVEYENELASLELTAGEKAELKDLLLKKY